MQRARLYLRGRTWWCWYYAADGERICASCKTRDRRTAERVALQYERAGTHPADVSQGQTVEGACLTLLADRRTRGRAASTLRFLEQKAGHLVRIFGASTPLSTLTAGTVNDYCDQRIAEGVTRHTVAHELGVLRAALRVARHRGQFDADPAAVMPVGWESGYEPRRTALTRGQVDRLMRELQPGRRPVVAFIVATGARWGEVERHRPEDWHGSTVALRGTKTVLSRRVVPVLPHVAALAQRARRGAPWASWPNVRRDLAAACKRARVPRVSPNDLRRTAATWLVEAGTPSNLVAAMLGHSTSRMVERVYGRVDGAALGQAIAAVAHLKQRRASRAVRRGTGRTTAKRRKPRKT